MALESGDSTPNTSRGKKALLAFSASKALGQNVLRSGGSAEAGTLLCARLQASIGTATLPA